MAEGQKKKVEYKVQLLDDSTISCRVEKGAKAEELINQVSVFLELEDKDYFGLQFNHIKQSELVCWLQSKKPIHKQIGTTNGGFLFKFRVKFYPPDPTNLLQENTRYLFVCQLKKDIAEGRLLCAANTECTLAAYALQAEMGDYDSEEHEEGYIPQCAWFFLNITPSMEVTIKDNHHALRGQSPADADHDFLNVARRLEMYGIHQHEAIDKKGTAVHLSAVWNGVIVFRCGTKFNSFSWSRVYKLDFKGRHFYIIFRSTQDSTVRDSVGFKFPNKQASKHFWRTCVEHHAFFRTKKREPQKDKPATERFSPPCSSTTRATVSGPPTRKYLPNNTEGAFLDQLSLHQSSTPAKAREAEDVGTTNGDRSHTLDRPHNNEVNGNHGNNGINGNRAYSTLPSSYRNAGNTDNTSTMFNSTVSVNSGSYRLGTSQDMTQEYSTEPGEYTNFVTKDTAESDTGSKLGSMYRGFIEQIGKEFDFSISEDVKKVSEDVKKASEDDNVDYNGIFEQISQQLDFDKEPEPFLPQPAPQYIQSSPSPVQNGNHGESYHGSPGDYHGDSYHSDSYHGDTAPALSEGGAVSQHSISAPSSDLSNSKASLGSSVDVEYEGDISTTIPLDLIVDVGPSVPDNGFSSFLAKSSKTAYSRLYAVTQELIYTERTYVKLLGLFNTFLREISIPNGPFSSDQISLIGNLYEVHAKFLSQLEGRLQSWGNEARPFIADILARNVCIFQLYQDYVATYDKTMYKLNYCLMTEPVFYKHVHMFEGRPSSIVGVPSLLLHPVLRIGQYQTLIQKLMDCIGDNDPNLPDFNDVYHELSKNTPPLAQELPKIMNCTVLQSMEIQLEGVQEVSVQGRVFLRKGLVKHIANRVCVTRMLVLLSDCLLYCKVKAGSKLVVQNMLPVRDIEIEEADDREGLYPFLINLASVNQLFEFYVDSPADREKWIHDIRFAHSTYHKRKKPETLPRLVNVGNEPLVQELCMVCGITLARDKRHRTCKLCSKVLCTRCSSWKLPTTAGMPGNPGNPEQQRVCENCYCRGDVRHHDLDPPKHTVQSSLMSYGGDDMLAMEMLSGSVYVRSQDSSCWRKRWIELIFTKLFFYESDEDQKPLGSMDILNLQVSDTRFEDQVSASYAFKIIGRTFSIIIATETRYSHKRWLQVLQKATLQEEGEED